MFVIKMSLMHIGMFVIRFIDVEIHSAHNTISPRKIKMTAREREHKRGLIVIINDFNASLSKLYMKFTQTTKRNKVH